MQTVINIVGLLGIAVMVGALGYHLATKKRNRPLPEEPAHSDKKSHKAIKSRPHSRDGVGHDHHTKSP